MTTAPNIPVVCSVCGTREYATASQIGKGIKCPDCFSINIVKEPPKAPPKPQISIDDGYQLQRDPIEIVKMTCTACHDPIKARAEHAGRKVR
ncbi:MAG: hypothetical protein KDB27_33525, partial [Planctomycetales bacterium]|nr:hypothetical protein [Planctomycetales bacterium]